MTTRGLFINLYVALCLSQCQPAEMSKAPYSRRPEPLNPVQRHTIAYRGALPCFGGISSWAVSAVLPIRTVASAPPQFPNALNESMARAAQYYLFMSVPTTTDIVMIPLMPQNQRWLVTVHDEICVVTKIYIWWPGKNILPDETTRCISLLLESCKAVLSGLNEKGRWETHEDSVRLYSLCRPRMVEQYVSYQFLPVNEVYLSHLRDEFSSGPIPLGVHLYLARGGTIFR